MKFTLVFILVIVIFGNFASAATDDTDITDVAEFMFKRADRYEALAIGNQTDPLVKRASSCPSGYYPVSGGTCCPNGSYKCTDGEGGCCDNGTTCLPNFKCSSKGSYGSYGSSSSRSTLESSLKIVPLVFSILQFF